LIWFWHFWSCRGVIDTRYNSIVSMEECKDTRTYIIKPQQLNCSYITSNKNAHKHKITYIIYIYIQMTISFEFWHSDYVHAALTLAISSSRALNWQLAICSPYIIFFEKGKRNAQLSLLLLLLYCANLKSVCSAQIHNKIIKCINCSRHSYQLFKLF